MEDFFSLSGKTFLVTGSEGLIGLDLCNRLLEADANVIACDLKSRQKYSSSEKNIFLECDLTTNKGLNKFEDFIGNCDVKIDGFVHCAYPRPASWGKLFDEISLDEISLHLNMQLSSSIILSRIICNYLKNNGGGSLVNISSIQGIAAPKFHHYHGTNMSSPIEYSCVKSSIIIMTKWLAKYFKNSNLNINCVSPGGVLDKQKDIFQNNYKLDCNNIGLLKPKNVSYPILFLLSDQAKGISGQNLIVDDGWSL